MNILERDSFILGCFLAVIMILALHSLVGALGMMLLVGITLNGVITVVLHAYLLYITPGLMMKWAPLVDEGQ